MIAIMMRLVSIGNKLTQDRLWQVSPGKQGLKMETRAEDGRARWGRTVRGTTGMEATDPMGQLQLGL